MSKQDDDGTGCFIFILTAWLFIASMVIAGLWEQNEKDQLRIQELTNRIEQLEKR